jgi:alkylation response protein AidB-like acyl-CoA dehydrogenase
VTRGYEVEVLARVIRPTTIYEGASEVQRLIIGRAQMRRTDPANGVLSEAAFTPSPQAPGELDSALELVVAARSLYERIVMELSGGASAAETPASVLIPFEIADMLVAIDAAELVWLEAAHRREEGAQTAGSLGIGALILAADAAERVEVGALALHHDTGLPAKADVADLSEMRYRAHAQHGSRSSSVMRLSERLVGGA